jgi:predicted GH43/DUF377 family glycosyl hydrolase
MSATKLPDGVCRCPDPDLCRQLKRHIHGHTWNIWRGVDIEMSPEQAHQYQLAWIREAGLSLEEFQSASMPSVAQKAANYVKAEIVHTLHGRSQAPANLKAARLAVCRAPCPRYVPQTGSCAHPACGCNLETKASWADQDCPEGRWPKEVLDTTALIAPGSPPLASRPKRQRLQTERCRHLGRATGQRLAVLQHGAEHLDVPEHQCSLYGRCTQQMRAAASGALELPCCAFCPDYDPVGELEHAWSSQGPRRLHERNLHPQLGGHRFNSSLIDHEDGYLLAWRDGWAGSQIWLTRLDRELRIRGAPHLLRLEHAQANYGREDPRLFRHQGRLHVAYVGVVGGNHILHTNVLYARLGDDLSVEQIYYPHYPSRTLWEKNWSFFSHDGALYAIYRIAPHQVLRIDGEQAMLVHQSARKIPWTGGELRGGASPVRVGDEYWSFCHDRLEAAGRRTYRTALYTFEARPPFRPLRYLPEPLLTARWSTKPADQYCAVVFTCGAVLRSDEWILSSGEHDRWTRIDQFDHEKLEEALRCLT